MADYKFIGDRVRTVRKVRGLSQEKLGQQVGYTSRSSVNKLELGRVDIPYSKMVSIADALGVRPEFLFFHESVVGGLSEKELALVEAYREHVCEQAEVDRLLDLDDPENVAKYTAAFSVGKSFDEVFSDRRSLEELPETDDPLI